MHKKVTELEGFKPPYPIRERILLTGPMGVGKTSAMLSVVSRAIKTGSDAKLYVLNSDGQGAIERMVYTPKSRFADVADRLDIRNVNDFEEWERELEDVRGLVRPQDWLFCDFISDLWEEAQRYYVEKVHGKEPEDYYLDAQIRLEKKKRARAEKVAAGGKVSDKAPQDDSKHEFKDWDVIKSLYFRVFDPIYKRLCCNVMATAQIRELRTEGMFADKKEERKLYGAFGAMPTGHKSLGHRFDTVLLLQKERDGYTMTTMKDRERDDMEDAKLTDFSVNYLMKIAGWRLK